MCLLILIGVLIRVGLCLYPYTDLSTLIGARVEISSPISSFKRLSEAIFLVEQGYSPYDGDVFHGQPLFILLFHPLIQHKM